MEGSETILHDTVMVDTCLHTPVHTKELYNAKSELYKVWTFVSNNGSILVQRLEQMYHTHSRCYNRETGYGGGGREEAYGGSLCILLKFSVNLQVL